MSTLALRVSYNGAPFCGFARQPGNIVTVQDSLEDALALLYRRPIATTCAGRTDTGVHALGQVVSFEVTEEELAARNLSTLQRSLNALTHEAIGIRAVEVKPDGFSARFDAKAREYRYFLATDACAPLAMRDFCWHLSGPLDVDAMRAGAAHLIGEHDFKSFCMAASAEGKPTCREVIRIDIDPVEIMGEQLLCVTVVGSSFLHSMVRTIVGTLVAVGRGRRSSGWVADVLAARDRGAAGENAPAAGLVFWHVTY
jgi:tRNA pseudouridine38-40 synthase